VPKPVLTATAVGSSVAIALAESIVAQVPVLQITLSHEVSNGRYRMSDTQMQF